MKVLKTYLEKNIALKESVDDIPQRAWLFTAAIYAGESDRGMDLYIEEIIRVITMEKTVIEEPDAGICAEAD